MIRRSVFVNCSVDVLIIALFTVILALAVVAIVDDGIVVDDNDDDRGSKELDDGAEQSFIND
jgi:hypothetical protein